MQYTGPAGQVCSKHSGTIMCLHPVHAGSSNCCTHDGPASSNVPPAPTKPASSKHKHMIRGSLPLPLLQQLQLQARLLAVWVAWPQGDVTLLLLGL